MDVIQRIFTCCCFALLHCARCGAQSTYPPNTTVSYSINNSLDTIQPYRGTYYDPLQPGTGIQIDVGADGNAFLTYYSYTQAGQPDWYILGGTYQASDEVTRWTTGVIGTMSGKFIQAFNGQSLGCPYKQNDPEAETNYTANLLWVNSREVKMTIGDQHWDFIAPPFDGHADGDYLQGNWVLHMIWTYFRYPSYGSFTYDAVMNVKVVPAGSKPTIASNAAANLTSYNPANDDVYAIYCNENFESQFSLCRHQMGHAILNECGVSVGASYALWYDRQTNRFGADIVAGNKIGPINQHVDLYMESPDLFIGRGITEGTGNFGDLTQGYGHCIDGSMNFEMILQRVPDAATGSTYVETH